MNGSPLYQRQIAQRADPLMRQVWDGTPWMADAYTGPIGNYGRYREIMEWCREQFGQEASPIHGIEGDWQSGGATVLGWTWIGFRTPEMMARFQERWGS